MQALEKMKKKIRTWHWNPMIRHASVSDKLDWFLAQEPHQEEQVHWTRLLNDLTKLSEQDQPDMTFWFALAQHYPQGLPWGWIKQWSDQNGSSAIEALGLDAKTLFFKACETQDVSQCHFFLHGSIIMGVGEAMMRPKSDKKPLFLKEVGPLDIAMMRGSDLVIEELIWQGALWKDAGSEEAIAQKAKQGGCLVPLEWLKKQGVILKENAPIPLLDFTGVYFNEKKALPIAKLLLELGANPSQLPQNPKEFGGYAPLMSAVLMDWKEMTNLLLDAGASLDEAAAYHQA